MALRRSGDLPGQRATARIDEEENRWGVEGIGATFEGVLRSWSPSHAPGEVPPARLEEVLRRRGRVAGAGHVTDLDFGRGQRHQGVYIAPGAGFLEGFELRWCRSDCSCQTRPARF